MAASVFAPAGSTGAGYPTRYVGATASGSPTYGAFEIGDFVVDRTGVMYICTAAGIPGTWVSAAALGLPLTGGTMSGAIAMGSHKITGLTNGSAASDAAAFGQVPVIGGTNFGPVVIGAGSLSAAQTANLLVMHVVNIPVAITVTGLVIANGATATGNVLVGLYSSDGTTLLGSSGSTAQTGTSSTQDVAFTSTYAAAAGTYIAGVIYSSSSATAPLAYTGSPASTAAQGGFSLPASVTPPAAGATAALAVASTY